MINRFELSFLCIELDRTRNVRGHATLYTTTDSPARRGRLLCRWRSDVCSNLSCYICRWHQNNSTLAAQTNESVAAPFPLEQTGRPLVERLARNATRLGGRPRASSVSGLDVFILVLVAAFGRQPFGSVAEVMLALFRSDEIVDGLSG